MERLDRPTSLTGIAVERLRRAIVVGEFAFGEALSESKLAAALGVSKTPVREALAQLRLEGLVDIQPQRGTFVFTPDEAALETLIDYRAIIELGALDLALERDAAELAGDLFRISVDMAGCVRRDDRTGYLDLDAEFHAAIFERCGNPHLKEAHDRMAAKLAALRMKFGGEPSQMQKSLAEHREIAEEAGKIANGRGDHARLSDQLERHIARREGSYWSDLEALT